MAVARRFSPAPRVRLDHNWVDVAPAKKWMRSAIMWVLSWGAEAIASQAKREAPMSTGHGRSWINATEDPDALMTYAGIVGPKGGTTRGTVPSYMGMIERGITPHKVSLKHYGLRKWFKRTFGESEAKPGPSGYYRSVLVWNTLQSFGGIKRERRGGKTAIPWLSRAIKHEVPAIRAKWRELSRRA